MCILDILTRNQAANGPSEMPRNEFRPHIPDNLPHAQRNLIETMWLVNPSKRLTILSMLQRLKQLTEKQHSEHEPHAFVEHLQLCREDQSTSLELFVFSDLESTILSFLDKLEWKCSICRESQAELAHIFQRIRDLYNLLQTQPRLSSAVESRQILSSCDSREIGDTPW